MVILNIGPNDYRQLFILVVDTVGTAFFINLKNGSVADYNSITNSPLKTKM